MNHRLGLDRIVGGSYLLFVGVLLVLFASPTDFSLAAVMAVGLLSLCLTIIKRGVGLWQT